MKDLYLMSPPAKSWSLRGRANFRSAEAGAVDALSARREWLQLAEAIERHGGSIAARNTGSGLLLEVNLPAQM